MIWRVLRYLGIVAGLVVLGLGLRLEGSRVAFPLGSLCLVVAFGYAVVAPVVALIMALQDRLIARRRQRGP